MDKRKVKGRVRKKESKVKSRCSWTANGSVVVVISVVIEVAGHILDLYCVRLSNAELFCENYVKLYFDAKHVEKGLNRGVGEIFGALSSKKCSFS